MEQCPESFSELWVNSICLKADVEVGVFSNGFAPAKEGRSTCGGVPVVSFP